MIKDEQIKVEIDEIFKINTDLNDYFEKNKVNPVKQLMCIILELEFLKYMCGFTEDQIDEIRSQAKKLIDLGMNGVNYCE